VGSALYPTDMPFGVSSGIPKVIIHAKFHVDRLRGFWTAGPPKVPFPILIGTILTTVLHYRVDCDGVCRERPTAVSLLLMVSTIFCLCWHVYLRWMLLSDAQKISNRSNIKYHVPVCVLSAAYTKFRERAFPFFVHVSWNSATSELRIHFRIS